jgi:hypothetical protein
MVRPPHRRLITGLILLASALGLTGFGVGLSRRDPVQAAPGPPIRFDFEGRRSKPEPPRSVSQPAPGSPIRLDFEGARAAPAAPRATTYRAGPPARFDFVGERAKPKP